MKGGRKGDILALLGLNLSGNRTWSTHRGNPLHDEIVDKCKFHLIYLGRGIYAELVKRDHPLVELNNKEGTKSLIIEMLTTVESGVVNKLVHLGLGFGIDRSGEARMDQSGSPEAQPSTSQIVPPIPRTELSPEVQLTTSQYISPTLSTELLPKTQENIGDSEPYMVYENLPSPSETQDDSENEQSIEHVKAIVEPELRIEW